MSDIRIHLNKELTAELDSLTAEINEAEMLDPEGKILSRNQIATQAVESFLASRRLPVPSEETL